MKYKISVIPPIERIDYLTRTILDGLQELKEEGFCDYIVASKDSQSGFVGFSKNADMILLMCGKGDTNFPMADKIDKYERTIFIDGSEVGKNRRFDPEVQYGLLHNTFEGNGRIHIDMLEKCALYLKREKPYVDGVLPLPFGIDNIYRSKYKKNKKKDIDFFCVFGQVEYPPLRMYVKKALVEFCKSEGFSCFTDKVSQEEFYDVLSRSKVGISVGGGGYDTGRFWEILGNNALLLTENIDILTPTGTSLDYKRIYQFKDLYEFEKHLYDIGKLIRSDYMNKEYNDEYERILESHSSKARVLQIIDYFKKINEK